MDMFRRKKGGDDDEDDDFDEDFDIDDLDDDEGSGDDLASLDDTATPDAGADVAPEGGATDLSVPEQGDNELANLNDGGDDDDDLSFLEGDDLEFDDDDEDDDDDEEAGLFDKPIVKYSLIGAIAVLVLVLVGLGAWLLLGSDSDPEQEATAKKSSGVQAALEAASSSGTSLNDLGATNTTELPASEEMLSTSPTGSSLADQGVVSGLNAVGATGSLNATLGGSVTGRTGLVVPLATARSYRNFPSNPQTEETALVGAPEGALLEFREEGTLPLPKISAEGEMAWQFYARPSDAAPTEPRVAVVITDMGLSKATSLSAIEKLPPEVSLSFSPYAEELEQWMIRSRRAGHEVLIGLPLGSGNFPVEDHGPYALVTSSSVPENKLKLEYILSALQGAIGVEVQYGSKFTTNALHVKEILNVLKMRGLMVLDAGWNTKSLIPQAAEAIELPRAVSALRLDEVLAKSAISAKLKELDALIAKDNQAIVTTAMSPALMSRLRAWLALLPSKGVTLVPVSALAKTLKPAPPE